jgi:ABC-type sugar transport system permease subunit
LLFALLMDYEKNKFVKNLFKIGAVFPAIISVVVIAQMWVAIYDPNWGLINSFLKAIGLGSLASSWLTDKSTVVICISIAYLWQYIGLNTLILYTGIKSIPHTYYEAAKLDGAGFWKANFHITIPLLSDVLQYVLILSTLGSMAQFAHIRVMTAGGPGFSSRSMIYEMYYNAFSRSDFGAGSAVAVLFIIQCLIVTFIINKLLHKEAIQY